MLCTWIQDGLSLVSLSCVGADFQGQQGQQGCFVQIAGAVQLLLPSCRGVSDSGWFLAKCLYRARLCFAFALVLACGVCKLCRMGDLGGEALLFACSALASVASVRNLFSQLIVQCSGVMTKFVRSRDQIHRSMLR